jgi:hypothetical protein
MSTEYKAPKIVVVYLIMAIISAILAGLYLYYGKTFWLVVYSFLAVISFLAWAYRNHKFIRNIFDLLFDLFITVVSLLVLITYAMNHDTFGIIAFGILVILLTTSLVKNLKLFPIVYSTYCCEKCGKCKDKTNIDKKCKHFIRLAKYQLKLIKNVHLPKKA